LEGVKDYMASITAFRPRDYQVEAVYDALRYNRKLLISPTASGKSFMIYSIVRFLYSLLFTYPFYEKYHPSIMWFLNITVSGIGIRTI